MGAAPGRRAIAAGPFYVFHDRVADFASVQRIDPALVMGTVIAHEVGHLCCGRTVTRQRG